jgi:ABC-2 type transport system ATP-binding protein
MNNAIDVTGLTKRYNKRAVVDDLSLAVGEGRILGFLGPNGSGKTTTMRLLCGLLTPDAGTGTCLGFDILTETAEIRRRVGYMTQRFGFYEDLTIRENLDFVARVHGLERRAERIEETLEALGLGARQHQLAGTLSGGWKQRLALSACVMHRPRLLLLDEPTAGVDPKARRDFWDQIHALSAKGMTVLVSTHYMDEAERCHEILYIAYGRLMARGTIRDVIARHPMATWLVEGPGIDLLSAELRGKPGIDTIAAFGAALHVSAADPVRLAAAIAPYRAQAGLTWHESAPNLEDVFIHLMSISETKGDINHALGPAIPAPEASP